MAPERGNECRHSAGFLSQARIQFVSVSAVDHDEGLYNLLRLRRRRSYEEPEGSSKKIQPQKLLSAIPT